MADARCAERVSAPLLEASSRARLLAREGLARSRRLGGGVEFAELRDYTPGDEPRWIDWRSSARRPDPATGFRLVVRRFVVEERLRVLVAVVVHRGLLYWDKLEAISFLAGTVYGLVEGFRDSVTTIVISPEWRKILQGQPLEQAHALARLLCDTGSNVGYVGGDWPLRLQGDIAVHRPELLVAVSDYTVGPAHLRRLLVAARAAGAQVLLLLATTLPEHRAPRGLSGAPLLAGGRLAALDWVLGEAEKHMLRVRAAARAAGALVVSVDGLQGARAAARSVVEGYMLARQHIAGATL